MSMVQDPLFFDPEYREAMKKYVEQIWWPAVKRDSREYDYWRSPARIRMGKFRIVASEGQEVLQE